VRNVVRCPARYQLARSSPTSNLGVQDTKEIQNEWRQNGDPKKEREGIRRSSRSPTDHDIMEVLFHGSQSTEWRNPARIQMLWLEEIVGTEDWNRRNR